MHCLLNVFNTSVQHGIYGTKFSSLQHLSKTIMDFRFSGVSYFSQFLIRCKNVATSPATVTQWMTYSSHRFSLVKHLNSKPTNGFQYLGGKHTQVLVVVVLAGCRQQNHSKTLTLTPNACLIPPLSAMFSPRVSSPFI